MSHNLRQREAVHPLNIDYVYLFILLFVVLTYAYLFRNISLTEDAGYYAFQSKEIMYGMVLHNDVPITTNSILIYITAFIFKLFGAGVSVYRAVHTVGCFILIYAIFKLVRHERSCHEALLAGILSLVFITIPYISADLGMNQIMWCLALILFGFYQKISHGGELLFGLMLALASITRETFAVVLVGYALVRLFVLIKSNKSNQLILNRMLLIKFMSGAIIGLLVNLLILLYYRSLHNYFIDMLHSGTSFRYQAGFLSIERISANLSSLAWCYDRFYCPIALFACLSYVMTSKNYPVIQWIKYFFVPLFLAEALLINQTANYSIIPTLVMGIILSIFFWTECYKNIVNFIKNESTTKLGKLRKALYIALFVIFFFCSVLLSLHAVRNIRLSFSNFYQVLDQNYSSNRNLVTERNLSVLEDLPRTSKISANAMYPVLFSLHGPIDFQYPYMFDLTAPDNLNLSSLKRDQWDHLSNQVSDILILKSKFDYLPDSDEFQKIVNSNYILIADFDKADRFTTVDQYKNRIYISKNYFNKNYVSVRLHKLKLSQASFRMDNRSPSVLIARFSMSPSSCMKNSEISNKLSNIMIAGLPNTSAYGYSIIQPYSSILVSNVGACEMTVVEMFKRRDLKVELKVTIK